MSTQYIPIRIIVADDHEIFRDGFKAMIKKQSTIELVGEAENGEELVNLTRQLKPDVIITDLRMPVTDGITATKQIIKEMPYIGIIALTMFDDETLILDMIDAGAKGFVLKNSHKDEMIQAIEMVHKGSNYYCNHTSRRLTKLIAESKSRSLSKISRIEFTERELSIIRFICQEFSNKEIAQELKLSVRTVEGYREKIQQKINARNTAGIVVYAIKNKIYEL